MDPFYALVAAGVPSFRDLLSRYLAVSSVTIADTCETALGVTRALRSHTVQLLVVDAGLPPDGAEAAMEALRGATPPAIIVTSARSGDGLWAYKLGAVDCLPSPLKESRLRLAVSRARERVAYAEILAHRDQLLSLLAGDEPEPGPPASVKPAPLVVRSGSELIVLDPAEVDWVEASGVYVTVRVGETEHLVRETLRHVEEQLDPSQFVRIHRSTILNLRRVARVVPHYNGGAIVVLKDGTELKMSRSYRERIHASIG